MKRIMIAMMAMMFAVGTVLASGDHPGGAKSDAAKAVKSQTVCPVMGRKIDKNLYVDYKGERLYVCCKKCIKKVNKKPEKWFKKAKAGGVMLDKAPAGKVEAAGNTDGKQTVCPVTGRKIDKNLYVDYKGERLYVCCKKCIKKVNKKPEKWFKKAKAGGVTLDKAPAGKDAAACAAGKKCATAKKMKCGCVGKCTCK